MKCVVISGISGFVGSAVAKKLLNNNIVVIGLDIVEAGKERLPQHKNLIFYKCNIFNSAEVKQILKEYSFDTFYHFAWIGSAGPLRSDYDTQIKNALCTMELMKLAKEFGCSKFVVSGTIMEFEAFEAIYSQESKPQTSYIYGVGKMLAHAICKPIANEIGIQLIWAYITNTFGVGESSPRLINSTIRKCINNEQLEFTAATQMYDFVYIDDVAEAFYLLGLNGKSNKGYVIGSGKATNLKHFLLKIVEICGKDSKPHFGNLAYTGIDLSSDYFSIEEIQKDCGFTPKVSFDEAIRKTFFWIKEVEKNG